LQLAESALARLVTPSGTLDIKIQEKTISQHKTPTILITRFAIKPEEELAAFDLEGGILPDTHLSRPWLDARLGLFVQWCLPSVVGQTKPFNHWLIFLDHRVPSTFTKKLVEFLPDYAELVFVHSGAGFLETLRKSTRHVGKEFVSTRLDADDALDRHYNEVCSALIEKNAVINFEHGYQYFIGKGLFLHRWIKSNPFISYWTTNSSNVFDLGIHSRVGKHVEVRNVKNLRPIYLKLAHDSNTAFNGFGGIPVLFPQNIPSRFGLGQTFPPPKPGVLLLNFRSYAGSKFDRAVMKIRKLCQRNQLPAL
jgi:hypothetical protein